MRMSCLCLAALFAALWLAGNAEGASLHISAQGDDAADGTAEAPVRSLGRLQALLAERPDIEEVVFHEGIYRGTLNVHAPQGVDAPPPLLLRAAESASPVLDGGMALPADEAMPLEESPGVFRLDAALFRTEAQRRRGQVPPLWDEPARLRYALVGDLRSVVAFPGSYTFEGDSLFIHTPDGRHPAEHSIEVGLLGSATGGLIVRRSDVTVRGMAARNYSVNMFSAGFLVLPRADRVVFEDCFASNCSRGFRVRGHDARLLRCRAEDVGCGVLLNGDNGVVEDGVFLRGPRDGFRIPMQDVQEDTGIEIYSPAGGDTLVRGNVIKGFSFGGVFVKCRPGEFIVERNTLVDNRFGVGWSPERGKRVITRHNVMLGSQRALHGQTREQARVFHRAYNNVAWPGPWTPERTLSANVDYMNSVGEGNLLANPRLAAPEADDFRLLPGSPCLDRVGPGEHAGALGPVPADFADVHPPLLDMSYQPALAAVQTGAGYEGPSIFAASRREFALRVRAHDSAGEVSLARVRVGDGPWGEPVPYAANLPVRLPADEGEFDVQAQVADDAGNWSEAASIRVRAAVATPRLVGEPTVRANQHGAVVSFRTNVDCFAAGEAGAGDDFDTPLLAAGTTRPDQRGPARSQHALGILRHPDAPEGPWRFRVRLTNRDGDEGQAFEGEFRFAGEPSEWFVCLSGEDADEGGTAERPWRTLQYAADRALPGDRVVIRPGIYHETLRITRGGAEGAPLVFASEEKWAAVLDGRRRIQNLIAVENASHVEFRGLELRWFGDVRGDYAQSAPAIRLTDAPDVAVRECKIWNDFWGGRLAGWGVFANRSPGFVLERCLLFRLDWAIRLNSSPRARFLSNTMRGFSHGGLNFRSSLEGTVSRNNCLTYYGNYAYWMTVQGHSEFESFDSDYNNLGTRIRHWRDEPGVVPNLPWSWGGSKTITLYQRFGGTFIGVIGQTKQPLDIPTPDEEGWEGPPCQRYKFLPNATTPEEERGSFYIFQDTFEDWQVFAGKDQNSIYAEPKHRDIVEFDFRLLPDSPNIGAGEGGTNIGAMPVYDP